VEREKHRRDGVSQRRMKWVFQSDCHPAPNLTITLKRMVKSLTDVLYTFLYSGQQTHVDDHYSTPNFNGILPLYFRLSCDRPGHFNSSLTCWRCCVRSAFSSFFCGFSSSSHDDSIVSQLSPPDCLLPFSFDSAQPDTVLSP